VPPVGDRPGDGPPVTSPAPRPAGATPWALAASVLAGTVLAGVAVVASGPRAALSVWLGVVVVAAFFGSGALPLVVVRGQETRAGLGTAVLLLTYTLRLAVAVAVLRLAGRSDAVEPRWTGLAVVVGALSWVAAQAVVSLRPPPAAGEDPHDLPGHGPGGSDR
jgi:hypothetical protein